MSIWDAFTGNAARDAAEKNAALYQSYGQQATGALDTALPKSTGALNSAVDAYTPLSDLGKKYGAASDLALDAYGANGAEGNARAVSAYQASPGFKFQVDTATDAAARNAAKLGLAGSGNTLQAISDRAGQIANTDYNNWRTGLTNFVSPELTATGGAAAGVAAGDTNLANLYQTDALNRAGIYGNVASGNANSNNQAAQAQMNASSQFWNALIGAAGNAARGYLTPGGKAS